MGFFWPAGNDNGRYHSSALYQLDSNRSKATARTYKYPEAAYEGKKRKLWPKYKGCGRFGKIVGEDNKTG